MIALAGAVHLPRAAIATIGIALIALHNVTNLFRSQLEHAFGPDGPNWLLQIIYFEAPSRLETRDRCSSSCMCSFPGLG